MNVQVKVPEPVTVIVLDDYERGRLAAVLRGYVAQGTVSVNVRFADDLHDQIVQAARREE
jgi:hypothetical protein